jgi:hypothetical protein
MYAIENLFYLLLDSLKIITHLREMKEYFYYFADFSRKFGVVFRLGDIIDGEALDGGKGLGLGSNPLPLWKNFFNLLQFCSCKFKKKIKIVILSLYAPTS